MAQPNRRVFLSNERHSALRWTPGQSATVHLVSPQCVTIHWVDAQVISRGSTADNSTLLHAWWLLDNDRTLVDPNSGQKTRSSGAIDLKVVINKAHRNHHDELVVEWSNGKQSVYPFAWLAQYAPPAWIHSRSAVEVSAQRPNLWKGNELEEQLPVLSYTDVLSHNAHLYKMLQHLHTFGLCFVRDVPTSDLDESANLAKRIGPIRETFYGRLWDVVSMEKATNVAYTSVELGAHMDLEYFEAPPGLQLLHCIRNEVRGGDSTYQDSFKAARLLQQSFPDYYKILKAIPVTFHYRVGNHHRRYHRYTIEEDGRNEYLRVNYAPQFQGPLMVSFEEAELFYPAFKAFESILNQPGMIYTRRMEPGDLVIFNNRRILHGRKQFDPSTGKRHLRGSYLDLDDYRSTYRILHEKHGPHAPKENAPRL